MLPDFFAKDIPLGRYGYPEGVAEIVALLACIFGAISYVPGNVTMPILLTIQASAPGGRPARVPTSTGSRTSPVASLRCRQGSNHSVDLLVAIARCLEVLHEVVGGARGRVSQGARPREEAAQCRPLFLRVPLGAREL